MKIIYLGDKMGTYNRFAEIYDNLISEDVNYSDWGSFILEKCYKNNIPMKEYLDLGSGTGNLALKICNSFSSCWCVDLSEDMLIIAESKFRRNRKRARFIRQNMIELNLNKKFDLITCALDCINYLTGKNDINDLFKAINNHISEAGIFIFDINSDYKLINILGQNTFTYNSDEVVYLWENDIINNIVEMNLTFFVKNGEVYDRFDEIHREKIYSIQEIEQAIERNGLHVLERLDNYTERTVSVESERITYIVSKVK